MARRAKPLPMELELKQRLDNQDSKLETFKNSMQGDMNHLNKAMDEILGLLKGSSIMNYPGIIKSFQLFEEKMETTIAQMEHWERWRQNQIAKKGTFTFRTATLFTKTLAVIGGIATLSSVIYGILEIIEVIKRLQQ
jgi:hypothetical protein